MRNARGVVSATATPACIGCFVNLTISLYLTHDRIIWFNCTSDRPARWTDLRSDPGLEEYTSSTLRSDFLLGHGIGE